MTHDTLKALLDTHGGILRTADAVAAGVTKDSLYRFAASEGLERFSHGIFLHPDALPDEMYLLQLRYPRIVFSHETALYLHGMAEMEPVPLSVTVPSKYNCPSLIQDGVRLYYAKDSWHSLGVCKVDSPSGFPVSAYDPERTICDIIRKCRSMDVSVFNHGIQEYMKRRDKDLLKLMNYARELRMEKQLREVIGVLL